MTEDVIKAMQILHEKYLKLNNQNIREIEAIDLALDYFARNPNKKGIPYVLVKFALGNAYKRISNRSAICMQSAEINLSESSEYNLKLSTNDSAEIRTIEIHDLITRERMNDEDKKIAYLLIEGWDSGSIAIIQKRSISNTRVRISRIRKKLYATWKAVA